VINRYRRLLEHQTGSEQTATGMGGGGPVWGVQEAVVEGGSSSSYWTRVSTRPKQTLLWSEAAGAQCTRGSTSISSLGEGGTRLGEGEGVMLEARAEPSLKDPPPSLKSESQPPDKCKETIEDFNKF
jgi:hypothetical protein